MTVLTLLSSKAPAEFLRLRCAALATQGLVIHPSSAGGVVVEDRVRSGDACDIVVLASAAIERLARQGYVDAAPRAPIFTSRTVAAVANDTPTRQLESVDSLRELTHGMRVGVSTGPSGAAVRAALAEINVNASFIEAPPGVPVAQLLADDACDVGFQQESEFAGHHNIQIIGPLPEPYSVTTCFDGAVVSASANKSAAAAALPKLQQALRTEEVFHG